jgi:hypothetical protein
MLVFVFSCFRVCVFVCANFTANRQSLSRFDYRWQVRGPTARRQYTDNAIQVHVCPLCPSWKASKLDVTCRIIRFICGLCGAQTYRGHVVSQTLIRAHFGPTHSTGRRYVYSGMLTDSVTVLRVVRVVVH